MYIILFIRLHRSIYPQTLEPALLQVLISSALLTSGKPDLAFSRQLRSYLKYLKKPILKAGSFQDIVAHQCPSTNYIGKKQQKEKKRELARTAEH